MNKRELIINEMLDILNKSIDDSITVQLRIGA